jgi:DNA-binding NarL/FixJ family response regulator
LGFVRSVEATFAVVALSLLATAQSNGRIVRTTRGLMTYVLIVDDHPFVASATGREVASLIPDAETRCVDSLAGAERAIEAGRHPDFILLDLRLPDAEGLSGLVRLRQAAPKAVIAIISGETSPQVMRDAFAQGARGYLLKTRDIDEFTEGLRKLFERGFYFPPEAVESAEAKPRPRLLTERETAALHALASGKVNKQLAGVLGVTESTFKTYLRAIYRKLGARTRVEAVSRARELGLLESRWRG